MLMEAAEMIKMTTRRTDIISEAVIEEARKWSRQVLDGDIGVAQHPSS